jgi:acyl-CoA hydrolase
MGRDGDAARPPDGQRAYQLITVAHPLFRGELAETARQRGLIDDAQVYALKSSVFHAIRTAPADTREALSAAALEKGLLTNDEHTQIVFEALVPKVPAAVRR